MPIRTPPKHSQSFNSVPRQSWDSAQSKPFLSPEVRVVEASAGSGKTYALAKRYVQLLLNPKLHLEHVPLRNILAITFTNKAAFEMKGRILEFLKKIALQEISPGAVEDVLTPIGVDPKTASQKAFEIMEALIRNYNFFQVQTIDKFINALLSGCAFKIDLTANFRIKTNSAEYLERSLDELIDRAPRDKATRKIFEYFLHQYLYLDNRTGWFPKKDILATLGNLFMQNNHYGRKFRESPFAPEDLIKKKRKILEQMKELRDILPEGAHKGFVTSLDKFLVNNVISFDVDTVSDYFAREEVPVRKDTDVPRKADNVWGSIRKNLQELCAAEAASVFNPYIQIFDRAMDQFYALTSKDDVLFLEQLNKRAGELFDEDHVTVEELYYRLATRFHHYLIDEFQDTSRLQWHNLEMMAEEALSTGGTLFYVGDKKQAIYSFRGGDVRLFDAIKERFSSFNVQVDYLANNWRSQKAIVEFNNHIFAGENLKRFIALKEQHEDEKNSRKTVFFSEADLQEVAGIFSNSQQTQQAKNDKGYVRVEYIDIDKKEERDAVMRTKLVTLVKDLRRRFAYRDITVLTRGNKEIEQLTAWFLEEGIPVESERTLNIQENKIILELMALLKFLDSPINNVSFANFILGDIFAAATGLKTEELHHFVFSLRERLRNEKDLYLYTEFRRQHAELWDNLLDGFFKNVGLYPLYELVISVYNKFACLQNFPGSQGFFMHFLELIKKHEEDHNDIESFLKHFENLSGDDLYVHIADSDALKLFTIHKSKGLEFPVVILPFLGMDIQVGMSSENQQSYVLREDREAMELLRLKEKYYLFSDELYQLRRQEYKKAFLSELNNVYVALTRPQYELYAFIPKKVGQALNVVKFLIPEEIYEQGAPATYDQPAAKGVSIVELGPAQYHDWIDYLKDEFLEHENLLNRGQRQRGEVLHFILSKIGNLLAADKKEEMQNAVQAARSKFPNIKDLSEYLRIVTDALSAQNLHPFFYIQEGEVHTEQDIVNAQGHTKRLDRLIVKKDEVWVVDYKPSPDAQGRYQAQVREYMALLAEIYPKKKICGYLVYLDELEIERIT
ncbi:MAG: hypothetical protein A3D10_08645 [Omnitrophica WOR_2 bacterium RIFCSPHIGHO2_02_FULL_48_11]|nr:MAG: hypothetical protein A3D10_08645 [Omnitrophica WOR_2 bacterium RIFCSPHIGHO2_02_FULL_48_11]